MHLQFELQIELCLAGAPGKGLLTGANPLHNKGHKGFVAQLENQILRDMSGAKDSAGVEIHSH